MSDETIILLALAAAIVGMFAFASVNELHWRQLFGTRKPTPATGRLGRIFGTVFLGFSLALCAVADPFSMALLVWPMLLGVAAAVVAIFVTLKSRHLRSK